MGELLPAPAGWRTHAEGDGWRRMRHSQHAAVMVLQARPTDGPCDPRGVAARLAQSAGTAERPALVEYRGWGRFSDRDVALQVLSAGTAHVMHAVWVDGGSCVAVAVTTTAAVAEQVGVLFAEAVAELVAGGNA